MAALELLESVAALLPTDASALEMFLRGTFDRASFGEGSDLNDVQISRADLVGKVLPHLQERHLAGDGGSHLASVFDHPKDVPLVEITHAAAMLRAARLSPRLRFLAPLCGRLRGACKAWLRVARIMLVSGLFQLVSAMNDVDTRVAAACVSLHIATPEDISAKEVAYSLLEFNAELRQLGLKLLGRLSKRGERRALGALFGHVGDVSPAVRQAALKAAAKLVEGDDLGSLWKIAEALSDTEASVRAAADDAILQLAGETSTEHVLEAALGRLKEGNLSVHYATMLRVVSRVAPRGEPRAIEAVWQSLRHEVPEVRQAAVHSLPPLVVVGDLKYMTAVVNRIHDQHQAVQLAALEVLPKISAVGNAFVISTVIGCVTRQKDVFKYQDCGFADGRRDLKPVVQCAALCTLVEVAHKGDREVLRTAIDALQDSSAEVRETAERTLEQVADSGDPQVVDAMIAQLDRECRNADMLARALNVLARIATKGDERVIHTVSRIGLRHEAPWVRRAALRALDRLTEDLSGEGGRRRLVGALLREVAASIQDKDASVRNLALQVLAKMAAPGDTFAVKTILQSVGASTWSTRAEALRALAIAAKRGDRSATRVALAALQDGDEQVRSAAVRALGALSAGGAGSQVVAALRRLLATEEQQELDPDFKSLVEQTLDALLAEDESEGIRLRGCMCIGRRS